LYAKYGLSEEKVAIKYFNKEFPGQKSSEQSLLFVCPGYFSEVIALRGWGIGYLIVAE